LLKSEKRSLYRFMLIYVSSTLLLFCLGAVLFYRYELYQIEQHEKTLLKQESEQVLDRIRNADVKDIKKIKMLDIAIYNGRKEYLYGTFTPSQIDWKKSFESVGGQLRYNSVIPPPHRQHRAYMVIAKQKDSSQVTTLWKMILWTLIIVTVGVLILGYFLGRLFIAPMREALAKLNRFVQDTTHELNTPISTILTNIEMLELLGKCKENEELKRIEIASKTLSRLYEDLSYLKLNEAYQRKVESINISLLLEERITYFSSLIKAKELTLVKDIVPDVIKKIDRTDAIRLYDNLISNAIKYNNKGGEVHVTLCATYFSISDTGRGMDSKILSKVFDRFERADESEGGFGIGLDIVSGIVKYYGYKIEIISTLGEGTTVKLIFS